LTLDFHNVLPVFAGNEQVIDPNRDVDAAFGVDVEAGFRIGSDETDFDEDGVYLQVPNSRRLFEGVEGAQ
jgi:hypothetical protein